MNTDRENVRRNRRGSKPSPRGRVRNGTRSGWVSRPFFAAVASTAVIALVSCAPSVNPAQAPESPSSNTHASTPPTSDHAERFSELEARFGRTVGVYAIDTGTGGTVEYRADERFGFASTMKALTAGFVLAATTDEQLAAPIPVTPEDIVPYSPVIEQSAGRTVTLLEAADAALRFSDNTAANLLLQHLGGPAEMERLLGTVGDTTTMVDRTEPELNDVAPGDDRDTSTPRALATALADIALGDVLDDADETLLIDLLRRNTTGDALIRAGAPDGWTIGDKTGTAAFGTRNDIAIAWPAGGGAPVVIAILTRGSDIDAEPIDEILAEAAVVVFDSLTER